MENRQKKGMESLSELYRTGRGPSSSHTMGPERACKLFWARNPSADGFKAVLYLLVHPQIPDGSSLRTKAGF